MKMIERKLIKQWAIWHYKAIGVLLILFGIWLYLKNIGIVPKAIFWPSITIAIGIACLVEANSLWRKL